VSGPGHRRRWWQWLLVGVVLLVVIVVGGAAIFVKSQPSAVPLTLPSGAARPSAGSADGTGRWGITLPAGFGFLGGLSSQATAEFLLILHRRE
jgi:hypothetical protein